VLYLEYSSQSRVDSIFIALRTLSRASEHGHRVRVMRMMMMMHACMCVYCGPTHTATTAATLKHSKVAINNSFSHHPILHHHRHPVPAVMLIKGVQQQQQAGNTRLLCVCAFWTSSNLIKSKSIIAFCDSMCSGNCAYKSPDRLKDAHRRSDKCLPPGTK
jgi:hypothetical protein